ncbi:MAG: chorismate mutase [Acutalibacteraceae bacterium]|nr:chorismate mutase [Acutalibacteraceae bacterium]
MADLNKAREDINAIDKQMAELFIKRMDAVKIVAEYKKEHGVPVTDAAREAEVIKRNSDSIADDDYRSYYVSFLQNNMELSKAFQHRLLDGMRVAYSGVTGAFANIVAKRVFPDGTAVGYGDFAAAYEAVVSGECDCALLPIENSFNGDVNKVLDLAFFGNLYITGIYEAEIVQNLLGNSGATLSSIKTVMSHPQALGQCAAYIEKYGFKTEEAVNTAVAAKYVAESGRTDIAAIASEEAAEEFSLTKIEGHINQNSNNTTRFAVFSRAERVKSVTDNHFVMLFTVKNAAGSLGRAVSVIGEHGFNLRALKSRPTKELMWDYYFYAEGEGSLATAQGEKMLKELCDCCNSVKVLGSFEKEIKV